MSKDFYTTWGVVVGGCGHSHRTYDRAFRCLTEVQAIYQRDGFVWDRQIRLVHIDVFHPFRAADGGPGRPVALRFLDEEAPE